MPLALGIFFYFNFLLHSQIKNLRESELQCLEKRNIDAFQVEITLKSPMEVYLHYKNSKQSKQSKQAQPKKREDVFVNDIEPRSFTVGFKFWMVLRADATTDL